MGILIKIYIMLYVIYARDSSLLNTDSLSYPLVLDGNRLIFHNNHG